MTILVTIHGYTVTRSRGNFTGEGKQSPMKPGFRPLPDVSKEAGITSDQARYWLTVLEIEPVKVGRVRHVSEDGAFQLVTMAKMVAEGKTPQQASAILKTAPAVKPEPLSPVHSENSQILAEVLEMKNVLIAVVGELKASRQESSLLRDQVGRLVDENRSLRLALLPPPEATRKVIPWHPDQRPDPAEGMGILRRAWVELTQPERLRRNVGN